MNITAVTVRNQILYLQLKLIKTSKQNSTSIFYQLWWSHHITHYIFTVAWWLRNMLLTDLYYCNMAAHHLTNTLHGIHELICHVTSAKNELITRITGINYSCQAIIFLIALLTALIF